MLTFLYICILVVALVFMVCLCGIESYTLSHVPIIYAFDQYKNYKGTIHTQRINGKHEQLQYSLQHLWVNITKKSKKMMNRAPTQKQEDKASQERTVCKMVLYWKKKSKKKNSLIVYTLPFLKFIIALMNWTIERNETKIEVTENITHQWQWVIWKTFIMKYKTLTAAIIKKEWYNRENATMEANDSIYKSQNSFRKSMYFEHAKRNF